MGCSRKISCSHTGYIAVATCSQFQWNKFGGYHDQDGLSPNVLLNQRACDEYSDWCFVPRSLKSVEQHSRISGRCGPAATPQATCTQLANSSGFFKLKRANTRLGLRLFALFLNEMNVIFCYIYTGWWFVIGHYWYLVNFKSYDNRIDLVENFKREVLFETRFTNFEKMVAQLLKEHVGYIWNCKENHTIH